MLVLAIGAAVGDERLGKVKKASGRGSLEEVLRRVRGWIENDISEHEAEPDVPYRVEYAVEEYSDGAMLVCAKLKAKLGESGAVIYGVVVTRETEEEYTLWVDDD
jgi:hypothetical protein